MSSVWALETEGAPKAEVTSVSGLDSAVGPKCPCRTV